MLQPRSTENADAFPGKDRAKLRGAEILAHVSGAQDRLDAWAPLKSVRVHVARNLDRRIPLDEAADVAGYERTYFSTYFRAKVGVTYTQWLAALRVSRAIELLARQELTIAEVADSSGFGDVRTLERNFRRYLSTTPSHFRRGLSS